MRNARLDDAQAGIKIAGRNINNLRYADDITLMAESEEELKSLLMKAKEWKSWKKKKSEKLNIQKTKIMVSGCITSWQIDGETMETVTDFVFLGSNSLQMVIAAMKLKDACSLEEKLWPSSVQWLSHIQLFATPQTAACQGSLSITNSWSLLKLMSIESVMPSNHFILCLPLLLLPSVFPSTRAFSSESVLLIRWPNIGTSPLASVLPMNIQGWFPLGLTGLISLLSKGLWRVFSSTTIQKNQFFSTQPSLWSNFHIHTWLLGKP